MACVFKMPHHLVVGRCRCFVAISIIFSGNGLSVVWRSFCSKIGVCSDRLMHKNAAGSSVWNDLPCTREGWQACSVAIYVCDIFFRSEQLFSRVAHRHLSYGCRFSQLPLVITSWFSGDVFVGPTRPIIASCLRCYVN